MKWASWWIINLYGRLSNCNMANFLPTPHDTQATARLIICIFYEFSVCCIYSLCHGCKRNHVLCISLQTWFATNRCTFPPMIISVFDSNFTEVCSYVSNWQYPSSGWDNVLAPNRRQAIISTNDGLVCWRIYASLGPNVHSLLFFHTGSFNVGTWR